ncbi:argininosuccinate lyase [Desulfonema ishimotonii]|uniref:Argininosuccinate lyase n=1 Tax=Desulfonema ishimotonii TaxID=45657 RepID=A0A401FT74_9BACT|nr:argininosuccinate lyase [Desulfonema ishimotonii]GBC60172.1 argininosuccinate lyase [Desulfonema ishimotonii]
MSEKLWDGRFTEGTDKLVERFTSSIDYDRKLYAYDIEGSIAHCTMLAKVGVLTDEERDTLIRGLEQVRGEIEAGEFRYTDSLEDIHMHIESRLAEVVGRVAQKLHTARSRNDQVALDIRMYLRAETRYVISALRSLRKALADLAEKQMGVILPGYTHTQRAQPVLLSHHLMAYYEMFTRDMARFEDCLKRINVMPLGSAALAGTTYPIDRHHTAELLDFPEVSANSMDSVADRDFAVEFMAGASLCMVHLSRISEEFILWSTSEFAFIEISDAFTTGSSIMPQKKNPDVCELVRGKTGRVLGDLMALLTLMKSLPMAYNRDMQEDKEPLFDAVDTLKMCVDVYARMLPHVRFRADVMEKATATGFLNATDMADYLVTKGMPFRQAHGVVGRAVSVALSQGKELHELSLEALRGFSDLISDDLFAFLTTEQMVNRRRSFGGTASENVGQAIAAAHKALEGEK